MTFMQRYSSRFRSRVKSRAWRVINNVVDFIRAPVRRYEILLVTGAAPEDKVADAESRLRFLFSHLGNSPTVRRAQDVTPVAYLRSAGVAAIDADAIPAVLACHIRWCADIDFDTNPDDGWDIMNLASALNRGPLKHSIAKGRAIFNARVQEVQSRGPQPVYLFGTGPTLNSASQRSFSDGITIMQHDRARC